MLEGLRRCGVTSRIMPSVKYRTPDTQIAIFYGLSGRLLEIFNDYPAAGRKAVYVDLGYWGRKDGGRFSGYHKMVVNSRHPTDYFQKIAHDSKRADLFRLSPLPWKRRGEHILITGMGPKGANAEGYRPGEWEAMAVEQIRKVSNRPIVYRPKPNWANPDRLPGARMAPSGQSLEQALVGCHAVVAHHSNAAIEAIVAGVPAFIVEGAAVPMAKTNLAEIEKPAYPEGRRQWVNDLAYTQWSIAEMQSGAAWAYLVNEGLLG